MTTDIIHSPHDKFFRTTMIQIRVAREFFESHLPPELLQQVDLSTLKIEKETFVTDAFKASEADLVYSVKLNNNATAYLYLLCEHLSGVDKLVAFRLLVYQMEVMKLHQEQHPNDPLPIVIPLVLYTGKNRWTASLDIFPLFGEQEELARSLWPPAYQLIDVHRLTDDELMRRNFDGLMEYAFKHAKTRDVEKFLSTLFSRLNEAAQGDLQQAISLGQTMVFYISNINKAFDRKILHNIAEKYLKKPIGGKIMTFTHRFHQEGKQEGIQIGIDIGKQQGIDIGMQQGIDIGKQQGEVAILKTLLIRRFGPLTSDYIELLTYASSEELLRWGTKLLDAKSLDEVFCGVNTEV